MRTSIAEVYCAHPWLVSVLYGFDDILNEIPLTHDHPIIPLVAGILILTGTGSLYKRPEKKFD